VTATATTPRPILWPTLFTALGVAVMLALGTWQVQRLSWKNALIAHIEARMAAPPVPLPAVIADPADWDYRRVTVTGNFRHDRELDLAARVHDGIVGYQIVTPLERADGGAVLVNRGFVPADRRDPASRAAGQVGGTVTVEGIARVPVRRGWMQPDNEPAKNLWFWTDLPAMAQAAGVAGGVAPVIVEAGAGANPGGLPIGGQTHLSLPNDHLQYAITWYALAVVLAVVYGVHVRRRT
jgi:surfeit locus 1 family protein